MYACCKHELVRASYVRRLILATLAATDDTKVNQVFGYLGNRNEDDLCIGGGGTPQVVPRGHSPVTIARSRQSGATSCACSTAEGSGIATESHGSMNGGPTVPYLGPIEMPTRSGAPGSGSLAIPTAWMNWPA